MWAKLFETVPTFGLFLPDNFIIVDVLSSFSFKWNQKNKKKEKNEAKNAPHHTKKMKTRWPNVLS